MNASDTERLTAVLENLGYEPGASESEADLLFFNTCSIRQKAEDRVYGQMKRLALVRRERPNLLVGITGCMVRKSSTKKTPRPDKLAKIEAVDIALRIEDLARLGTLIKEVRPAAPVSTDSEGGTLENYFKIAPKRQSKAQVWIPIQTGCDKFCTFCIVPFTRGRERSRSMQEIIDECTQAVENGAVEITLIGQTVDSYGLSVDDKMSGKFTIKNEIPNVVFSAKIFEGDGSNNRMASAPEAKQREKAERPFVTLLREIDRLKSKGLRRLRFTSPHPHDFSEDLILLHNELDTLQPYIHLPVQSGSSRVLKDMRRTYTREHYLHLIDLIRQHIPACAITSDMIVGFCGETEENFEESYRMMEQVEWDMVFLAVYSSRKGTHAQKHLKDDVPMTEKKRRFQRINALLRKISRKKHEAFVGRTVEVLVEKQEPFKPGGVGRCSGRTPEFKEVFFDSGREMVGKFAQVRVTAAQNFFLEGELA